MSVQTIRILIAANVIGALAVLMLAAALRVLRQALTTEISSSSVKSAKLGSI